MSYDFWVVLHLLVIGYWLGADLGVYYLSGTVVDSDKPAAVRTFAARAMLWLDMVPRTCLILTLSTGLAIGSIAWFGRPPGGWWWVWPLLLAWLALTWAVFLNESGKRGHVLSLIDIALRVIVISALLIIALITWTGLATAGMAQPWLAGKLLLLALIMGMGLVVRVQLRGFGPLFAKVAAGEADASVDRRLAALIAQVKIPVWVIWISVIAAAFIGRFKPMF